jgi:putative dimethyl sulfoxide reductase chaperone
MNQNQTKTLDSEVIGCGLRDFFIAASGSQILPAYQQLKPFLPDLPLPQSADEIEFCFNRLFIGPGAPIAPPFASVYLEEDALVMGRTTLDARDLYASIGLASPWQGRFPDDHISLELDACLHFRQLGNGLQGKDIAQLYQRFLEDHLLLWVPTFVERIAVAKEVPATIQAVADLLLDWLRQELTSLTQKGE